MAQPYMIHVPYAYVHTACVP